MQIQMQKNFQYVRAKYLQWEKEAGIFQSDNKMRRQQTCLSVANSPAKTALLPN